MPWGLEPGAFGRGKGGGGKYIPPFIIASWSFFFLLATAVMFLNAQGGYPPPYKL